nr:periplasmic maltose-binding protein [Raoultella sp. NCTC 9187]
MPMFLSQTAIAWNSETIKTPPASYDELVAWAQKNPQAFGYNGLKTACPGSASWWAGCTPTAPTPQRLSSLPYDKGVEKNWGQPMKN